MEATKSEMKDHLKLRRSKKYLDLYRALEIKFKECRAKGYRISFAYWSWSLARRIYRDQTGDESVHVGHHIIVNFIKRYNLRMRKKQHYKNVSKEDMRVKMQEWHTML